ncbi:MAG: DUF885 family protein [Candidatus Bathyarchaeia archaeon]
MTDLNDLDNRVFDLYSRINGVYDHEKELFVPSEHNIRGFLNEIGELRVELQKIKKSAENRVWAQHIEDLLDGMEVSLLEDMRYPSKYLRYLGYSIIRVLEDERENREKAEILISKLSYAKQFFESLKNICLTASDSRIERAIICAKNMEVDLEYFVKIAESWLQSEKDEHAKGLYLKLIEEFNKLKSYIDNFIIEAQNIKGKDRRILEDIPYATILNMRYGISLDWLLMRYEDELEKACRKFEELAAKLDPSKKPIDVLRERIHIPYDSPEEMFAAMKNFLKIAREKARNYLDFPEGESCEVIGVKEMEKDIYPMGHSGGPDPIKGGLKHTIALNQYNFRAFTKGWLMMMAIHEAYYGHNIHWIKIAMANLPKTFKIEGGKEVPLVEGLAHRGEELLQYIYEDEAFPLFVAWRRIHTALRVYIDVKLFHLKDLTPEDAVKLYMEIMGFDEQTSKGLVEAHLESRGYFVCYLAGYKMIEEIRKKVNMSEKEFSDKLFSAGFLSMNCIKMLFGINDP